MSWNYSNSGLQQPHTTWDGFNFSNEHTTSSPGQVDPGQGRDSVWYLRVGLFGAGGAVVACFGIVCNIITIVVLANFRTKSSAPFLLSCLSVSDTIHLLFLLVLENLPQLAKHAIIDPSYNESPIVQGLYSKMFSVHFVTQTLSIYTVVVITLERYVVVRWPFKAKTICSLTSARIAMVFVLLFALLINLPHYLAYKGVWVWRNETQTEQFYIARTSLGGSYFYLEIFYKWMQMTFNFIIPLSILMCFNGLAVLGLRRNTAATISNSTRRESENRLTIMIGCMTAIFFICELMAAIGHVMLSGYNSYSKVPASFNRFVAVSDFLMMVNAAVNFAIYCVTGKKFRETFRKMFTPTKCGQCFKRPQHGSSSSSRFSKQSYSDTKKTTLSSEDLNRLHFHGSSQFDSLPRNTAEPLLDLDQNEALKGLNTLQSA